MERIRFVEHKGKRILLEDFSAVKPGDEFKQTLDQAALTIRSQPLKSVLAVFDATDANFDMESLTALGEFVKKNTPFMKYATVVGITGLLTIALQAVQRVGGRDFKVCSTREEALDFLAGLE
ncbi:MAG: hypothetical protein QUS35_13445 [bacterium]|nr:hypothetical protein [bacterium]